MSENPYQSPQSDASALRSKHVGLTLLLVSVTAIWGWTFVVVKDAIDAYPILCFLAIRFTIASGLIGVASVRTFSRRSFSVGAGIGVVLAVAYYLQTLGLRYTTPTNCGLITGLFVVFVPIANRILFRVKTARVFWAAIAASVVGLALLTNVVQAFASGNGATALALGDFITLGAAAAFGVHVALLDRYAKHHDATTMAFGQISAAAALFWIVCPVTETFQTPGLDVWIALLITGVLATAAAFFIQTYVQQRIPAVRTAVIISLEPVFAAAFGFALAGDRLGPVQIAGAVLMIGAVFLAEIASAMLQSWRNGNGNREPAAADSTACEPVETETT